MEKAKEYWESLSIKQQDHFLKDHKTEFKRSSWLSWLGKDFDKLPDNVKKVIAKHVEEGLYKSGGSFSEFLAKAKNKSQQVYSSAKKSAKELSTKAKDTYSKTEKGVKEKVKDQKRKIALDVIDETKDRVKSNKEKIILKATEEIVASKYADGGEVDDIVITNEYKEFDQDIFNEIEDENLSGLIVKQGEREIGIVRVEDDVLEKGIGYILGLEVFEKGYGKKIMQKAFHLHPTQKAFGGKATSGSKGFWLKLGAEFDEDGYNFILAKDKLTETKSNTMLADGGGVGENYVLEKVKRISKFLSKDSRMVNAIKMSKFDGNVEGVLALFKYKVLDADVAKDDFKTLVLVQSYRSLFILTQDKKRYPNKGIETTLSIANTKDLTDEQINSLRTKFKFKPLLHSKMKNGGGVEVEDVLPRGTNIVFFDKYYDKNREGTVVDKLNAKEYEVATSIGTKLVDEKDIIGVSEEKIKKKWWQFSVGGYVDIYTKDLKDILLSETDDEEAIDDFIYNSRYVDIGIEYDWSPKKVASYFNKDTMLMDKQYATGGQMYAKGTNIDKTTNKGQKYIVNNSNQIKLADGTFDEKNPDIRFEKGGILLAPNGKPSNLTPEQYENENREMVLNNNKQIAHHTKELAEAVKDKHVPAWVVAKVNRSASDLSDATHYMEGHSEQYAKGGLLDSRNTYEDYNYNVWYRAPLGYYVAGADSFTKKMFAGENNYFNTSDEAKEHAEMTIYFSLKETINDPPQYAKGTNIEKTDMISREEILEEVYSALDFMMDNVNSWAIRDRAAKLSEFDFYDEVIAVADEDTAYDILSKAKEFVMKHSNNEYLIDDIYDIVGSYSQVRYAKGSTIKSEWCDCLDADEIEFACSVMNRIVKPGTYIDADNLKYSNKQELIKAIESNMSMFSDEGKKIASSLISKLN